MRDSIGVGKLPTGRYWMNKATQWVVAAGGAGVIGAITLIFAYLLWVVGPIFIPGDIDPGQQVPVVDRNALLVDVSENGEAYMRLSDTGILEFYNSETYAPVAAFNLGNKIKKAQRVYPEVDRYAVIDEQNRLSIIHAQYIVSFSEGIRYLTPRLEFPFTNRPIELAASDKRIAAFDTHFSDGEFVVAAVTSDTLTGF